MQKKIIIDTKLFQAVAVGDKIHCFISMSEGGAVETEPFANDQRGLVSALNLAAEVNAGKIWLKQLAIRDSLTSPKQLEVL